jgi:NADH-quinone oxidoreductase subunit N
VQVLQLSLPQWSSLGGFRPEIILCATFLVAVLGDLLGRGHRRPGIPFLVTLLGTLAALAFAVVQLPLEPQPILGNLVVVDGMAAFFRILFIVIALMTILSAWASEEIMGRHREHKGEFYALVALLTAAMSVMAESRDILMLYLSMEMVGLTSYILAGYMRTSLRSTEASLKYVIYGGVSSGIMLYGLSLLYGLTGETTFAGIRDVIQSGTVQPLPLLVIIVLVLAGLGYKIAMVPFHFWCPDVYEGAPTPVAAFFSVGPKAAGFALMIRFFYTVFVSEGSGGGWAAGGPGLLTSVNWPLLIALLSAVTMTYGNVVALRQSNVKRMLAYSSIAHVGYLLMGFLLLTEAGLQAILFYLLVYALMNLGAFFFVVAINNRLRSEELSDYAGLGFRAPWAAAMMVVFLFALTGLPPTAGFIGKFYLFAEVIHREYFWLAIVGVLNSVISLFYYMRIGRAMYFTPVAENAEPRLRLAPLHMVVLGLLAVPTLVLGVYWAPLKAVADQAIARFAGI